MMRAYRLSLCMLGGLLSALAGGYHSAALAQQSRPSAAGWTQELPVQDAAQVAWGQKIYLEGRRPTGEWVRGMRYGNVQASGEAVACVMCHRRSGLGAVEGTLQISPISGRYLFDQDSRAVVNMNLRTRKAFNQRHDPYTAETLAAALRTGIHISGRELNAVMPRFDLSDQDVQGLMAYLRQLSSRWSPGVTPDRVRFATVITPDVTAERKKTFLDTLQAAVQQKNSNFVPGQRTMSSAAEMVLKTQRFWDVDVWELQGPASTWNEQLLGFYRERPVFALISGLGGDNWQPIHAFSQRLGIPGWFPSVTLPPPQADDDFYSIYFSRGVMLDADVIAHHLRNTSTSAQPLRRLVQIFGPDAAQRGAADALTDALKDSAIHVEPHALKPLGTSADLKAMLSQLKADEAVMFWLSPEQLKLLEGLPVPAGSIFFSARLAGGESAAYPLTWKNKLQLVYPYELPQKRQAGLIYFKQWLKTRQLDLVDELLQSEVYFALDYLNDTMVDMLDNLHRDYLLERAENMLSWRESARAEDQAREWVSPRQQSIHSGEPLRALPYGTTSARMPRPQAHRGEAMASTGKRESTTIYPRLSLAQRQRHASKGAYIVRFSDPAAGHDLTPQTEWIVP
jgi:cytochrome c553